MTVTQHIPTHLITGFLGVGKTTTINRLLGQLTGAGEDVLVVINELGQVGIDGSLLDHPSERILTLDGGCMCCALRVMMETRLAAMLRRKPRPSRILIEPTGVGHPQDLAAIIAGEHLGQLLSAGPHVVVVDPGVHAQQRLREHPLYRDQWAVAQIAAMSKTDLASASDCARLQTDLAAAGLPVAAGGREAQLSLLSSVSADSGLPQHQHAHGHDHNHDQPAETDALHGYVTRFYRQEATTVDHRRFAVEWSQASNALPASRAKGFIRAEDGWQLVQAVGPQVDCSPVGSAPQAGLQLIYPEADEVTLLQAVLHRHGFAELSNP